MSLNRTALFAAVLVAASAGTAAADQVLLVEFQERETGDSFKVSNVAPCEGIRVDEVSIDFATARSGLFFDVAPGEPGYPDEPTEIEVLSGAEFVEKVLRVEDGAKVLTLQLRDFMPGDSFRFHVDVDDESGPVPGPDDDASARDLEGSAFAAIMFNKRDFRRAEITAFGETGNARLVWPRACIEQEVEPEDGETL